jgi:hypothetical protein
VPGRSSSTSLNVFQASIICCRQTATLGWLGAPVNRMFTVTSKRSGWMRQVKRVGPPYTVPSTRSNDSKSSRPTVTGPATASRAVQVAVSATPVTGNGGVREPWNSRTARRVGASKRPVAVGRVGTSVASIVSSFCWSSSTAGPRLVSRIVGWTVPVVDGPRASGVPDSTTIRPDRTTRGASSSSSSHVSSVARPFASSGGCAAWNADRAAVVSGPNIAVIRNGGVAPSALSACWIMPISTCGPSPSACIVRTSPIAVSRSSPDSSSRMSSTSGLPVSSW